MMYVEQNKTIYHAMLVIAKKINYSVLHPGRRVCHFLNGITDPSLVQAKISLTRNTKKCAYNFDSTMEYLTIQVLHQQDNQWCNNEPLTLSQPRMTRATNWKYQMCFIHQSNGTSSTLPRRRVWENDVHQEVVLIKAMTISISMPSPSTTWQRSSFLCCICHDPYQ